MTGWGTSLASVSIILLPLGTHGVFLVVETTTEAFNQRDITLAKIIAANIESARGLPKLPPRLSNADSGPLAILAHGTVSPENWCSPPQSTTSNKLSNNNPYAVCGFNRGVRSKYKGPVNPDG